MRVRAALTAAFVAAFTVLCGCSTNGVPDKSGGDGPVLILRMATSEQPGSAMAPVFTRLADEVRDRSEGRLRLEVTYTAMGRDVPKFDQAVAELVQDGDYDLALVPARSWDDLGVSSLRALQAPFLVDSDDLVDAVVTGDLAEPFLAGLDRAGVRGLALWPEALRHPIGYGTPLVSLEDFKGVQLRAPYSKDVYAVLRAFGSAPVDLDSEQVSAAYAAGDLAGAETGSDLPSPPGSRATITADITLYGKVDTVVANDTSWARLTDEQQEVVERAALVTRDWLVDQRPREAQLLERACEVGVGVTRAGPALATFVQTAQPIYDALREDPDVGPMVEGLEQLKQTVPAVTSSSVECASPGPAPDIGPRLEPAVLDGTYRATFTYEELVESSDSQSAQSIAGPWTIVLDGGSYHTLEDDCTATYEVSETQIEFRWDPGLRCTGDWTARWERTERGLRFSAVQSNYLGDRVMWSLHEWVRID